VQMSDLAAVNRQINADVRYRSDLDLYGRPEWWAVAEGAGDCEDYALSKYRALRALGWPQDALDFAICWTERGAYHAVLLAHLGGETWVLDNRRAWPTPWRDMPYRWDRRTVGGSLRHWHAIAAAPAA